MKKVGIILVNYKDYANRFLRECRDSLRLQNYPVGDFKVYIVDNAASPETQEYLKNNYPEAVILARPDGNYSAANNLGAHQASADGCEYIVVANMDTKFDSSWLSALVEAADKNSDAGAVQSKILLYPNNLEEMSHPKINTVGNSLHFLGFGFHFGYDQDDYQIDGYPEIDGYGSGCSLLLKKEIFEAVGGYDEEYYMYHDDIELCLKVRLAGYKIILAPKSIVYHKYEFSRSVRMLYYMERNRYLMMFIFYPWTLLLVLFLPMVIMDLGMIGFSIKGKWFKTKISASSYFLSPRTWRFIRQQRSKIDRRNFSKIVNSLEGKLEFSEVDNPVLKYIANPMMNFCWRIARVIYKAIS